VLYIHGIIHKLRAVAGISCVSSTAGSRGGCCRARRRNVGMTEHMGGICQEWIHLKDLVTPNISACRKVDNVYINVLFIS
jgi:hypothetical protein